MAAPDPRRSPVADGADSGAIVGSIALDFAVSAQRVATQAIGTLSMGLIFAATARSCGPYNTASSPPGRPVSVNAIAASLDRPFETTRRHVNTLIDLGLISRSANGLSVPARALCDPRAAQFADQCHDLLVDMIERLRARHVAIPAGRDDITYDPRSGVGIAFDMLLAAFECHGVRERNWTRLALLLALDSALDRNGSQGVAKITRDAIRPSDAARMLGLPYATTLRNIDALVHSGALVRSRGGVWVVTTGSRGSIAAECQMRFTTRARQLIGRLAASGFPMHHPDSAYIVEPSKRVDLLQR